MTFTRPHNITLTQMAQWVDANSYNPERDDNKLVEYLYHLIYSRAQQASLFTDYDTYDDFALYCVSKFFIRFANTQEPPVKSVVNYIRTVLQPWKAEYIREFCCGDADLSIADFNASDFSDYLIDVSSEFDYKSYSYTCLNVSHVVRQHLKRIPRNKNSAEWSNIYISCMLTLQDRIKSAAILCDKNLAKENPELINRIIRGLKTKPPILFHIEPEKSAYITVLVNELTHALATELTYTMHTKVSVESCLQSLVKAASNKEEDE